MDFQLTCKDDARRLLLQNSTLNGIKYLEVIPPDTTADLPLLVVFCFQKIQPPLGAKNVQITGGTRITKIGIEWAMLASSLTGNLQSIVNPELDGTDPDTVLVVRPTSDGDYSTYTLRIVDPANPDVPPDGYDTLLSQVEFGFKVECPPNFDCRPTDVCPPQPLEEPVADYLAKDYESFRRLMLDRLSLIMPNWQERNPADLGVMLVEVLAYVGDQLSYYQDAVATEAYLGTARRRVSVRRHARLLDYFVHDGCNARAWVAFEFQGPASGLFVPKGTGLLTGVPGPNPVVKDSLDEALIGATVFETMEDKVLYSAHNLLNFYTWNEEKCCLPAGATAATLRNDGNDLDFYVFTWDAVPGPDSGALEAFLSNAYALGWTKGVAFTKTPDGKTIILSDAVHSVTISLNSDSSKASVTIDGQGKDEFVVATEAGHLKVSAHTLRVGDILIFEEVLSPNNDPQPNPSHRFAVRLTSASSTVDDLDSSKTPLLDISWDAADAADFPLCLETVPNPRHGNALEPVSVARGNVVLADHGSTACSTPLPPGYADEKGNPYLSCTESLGYTPTKPPFRPALSNQPLTFAALYDPTKPASSAFEYDARGALPDAIILGDGQVWSPRRDLFSSDAFQRDFVVEKESDGTAYIRFGDDELGKRPISSTDQTSNPFYAIYRTGNGAAGNVGREAVNHIANSSVYGRCVQGAPFDATGITKVRNPMEAHGGTDPESIEEVRQYAPYAFKTQQRAVTAQDYSDILEKYPRVQKAYAELRWTGSWYTVYVSVDRLGGAPVDDAFKAGVVSFLDRYRLAGYDLQINDPAYVPLEIALHACASPGFSPTDVRKAVLEAFSSTVHPDGTLGFFHPDNFTFGQPVYLSEIYKIATSVPGVSSVTVETFQRWGKVRAGELANGVINVSASEIARLNNDPNFPENGILEVTVDGSSR